VTPSSATPYLALTIHDSAAPSVGRCMSSAASGMPLIAGARVSDTLARLEGPPRLMIVGHEHVDDALAALGDFPDMRLAVLTPDTTDRLLATARTVPQIVALLAWLPAGVRPWELSYVVRRAVAPEQASPPSSEVLLWGASSVTWRPRTSEERERSVRAVELVAGRFGIDRQVASTAADAAHELLMNAMIDAPVDARGRPRHEGDRLAPVVLEPDEVPTMQLTVDSSHLAIDVSDPFGRLTRGELFGGILEGRRRSAPEEPRVARGQAFHNLFSTAAVLRVEVAQGRHTLVSWMLDRALGLSRGRAVAKSLYYLPA